MPQSVLVIAEAGVNHDGSRDVALELVDAAADSGADIVKFQTFDTAAMMTSATPKAAYQTAHTDQNESYVDMGKRLELAPDAFADIASRCADRGIEFLSTAFDDGSLNLLLRIGLKRAKVPSGEVTNLPYLRRVASLGLPVIMSTGMATLDEVGAALDVLLDGGLDRSSVTLLHCTTEYPAPLDEVNLRAMITLRDTFGTFVGYSDHTEGIVVPVAAVAMGACVIEKHITLDRSLAGPDHAASLEPDSFGQMVQAIRDLETALGDADKAPTDSEVRNRDVARRSIVALRSIDAGEALTAENLTTKRPGTGLSPMLWDEVLGTRAKRNYDADELIEK